MELNELKSSWQNAGDSNKNQQALQQMTRIQQHPKLRRIRVRLLIEALFLTTFLPLYYSAFDGDQKPVWANLLLVAGMLFFVVSNLMSFLRLRLPFRRNNIRTALAELSHALKRLSLFSLAGTLLLGGALLVFFSRNIEFDTKKLLLFFGVIVTTLIAAYISWQTWQYRIHHIRQAISELEE